MDLAAALPDRQVEHQRLVLVDLGHGDDVAGGEVVGVGCVGVQGELDGDLAPGIGQVFAGLHVGDGAALVKRPYDPVEGAGDPVLGYEHDAFDPLPVNADLGLSERGLVGGDVSIPRGRYL